MGSERDDINISPREAQVLNLIAQAMTNDQIATKLCIAPATAKRHVSNILTKLGAVSRLDAVARAYRGHFFD